MSRQDVSCFITTTHHDNDDDDEFVVESSDRVDSNPRGWLDGDIVNPLPSYFARNLHLHVRTYLGEGGLSFSGWLNSRSQNPLSNYYLTRCPSRARCQKCDAAQKLTCRSLGISLCPPCQEGLSLYCIGLEIPLLCPSWGPLEIREYKERQGFFREGQGGLSNMSTRTVDPTRLVLEARPTGSSSTLSGPMSKLREGWGRLRRAREGVVGQVDSDKHEPTLAQELQEGRDVVFQPDFRSVSRQESSTHLTSLEEEIKSTEMSQRALLRDRHAGMGSRDNWANQPGSQLVQGFNSGFPLAAGGEVSGWEEGYSVGPGVRCPIDPHHCISTPNRSDNPPMRPDPRGISGLSSVASGGARARRHELKDVDQDSRSKRGRSRFTSPERVRGDGQDPRRVHFGRSSNLNPILETGAEFENVLGFGVGSLGPPEHPTQMNQSVPGVFGDRTWGLSGPEARVNQSAPGLFVDGAWGGEQGAPVYPNAGEARQQMGGDPGFGPSGSPFQSVGPRINSQRPEARQVGGGYSRSDTRAGEGNRSSSEDHGGHWNDGSDHDPHDDDHGQGRRDPHRSGGGGGGQRRNPPRRPAGGGGGGGQGGGGGDESDNTSDSDGSILRQPRQRSNRRDDGNLSSALNMIVDRLERLPANDVGRASHKERPVSVPAVVRQPDGSVTALDFFQWVMLVTRLADELKINKTYILIQISTDVKILPAPWRQVCLGCKTLSEAILRLIDINPPKASTFPLLVAQLTGLEPTDGSHEQIIERSGELLASLSLLQSLHPGRDLTREQFLASLFSLGSSLELQAGVMELVAEVDHLKQLPLQDGRHQDYVVSLASHLEKQRKVRVDILASVACGQWSKPKPTPSLPSYAQPVVPVKNREADGGRSGKPKGSGQGGARAVGSKKARVCGFSCGQDHFTWLCPKTLDVRLKKIPVPVSVCKKCCSTVEPGLPHKPECHLHEFSSKTDGKRYRINRLCSIHSVKNDPCHALLCVGCGKDPRVPKPMPVVSSCANPLISSPAAQPVMGTGDEVVAKVPQVIFMSEVLTLVGVDGSSLSVIVHYDTMSGCSFAHNVPETFNHGRCGLMSELFSLSTFIGEGSYSLPVMTLKIAKKSTCGQSSQLVTCFMSDYPTINPIDLPHSLKNIVVGNASQGDLDSCSGRIMLGAEYSQHFPKAIKTPPSIRESHSGITAYQSQFSGRTLLAGQINRAAARLKGVVAPFFMTVPEVHDQIRPEAPARQGVSRGALRSRVQSKQSAVTEGDVEEVQAKYSGRQGKRRGGAQSNWVNQPGSHRGQD